MYKCRRGPGSPEMEKASNDERKGHAAELTNCYEKEIVPLDVEIGEAALLALSR
jgi:hypothetical protein